MTLGLNTSRLVTATTGCLLAMGTLFTLVAVSYSDSTGVFKQVDSEALAIYTVLVALMSAVVSIGIAGKGPFYSSSQFWKYLCAVSITANVLVGAHKLTFGSPSEFLVSTITYFTQNYAIVLIGITVISKAAYIYLERSGGSIWESVGQPIVALLIVSGISTVLFAVNSNYALIALAGFLGGFTLHQRQRKHKRNSSSAEAGGKVSSFPLGDDDTPALLKRQAD